MTVIVNALIKYNELIDGLLVDIAWFIFTQETVIVLCMRPRSRKVQWPSKIMNIYMYVSGVINVL